MACLVKLAPCRETALRKPLRCNYKSRMVPRCNWYHLAWHRMGSLTYARFVFCLGHFFWQMFCSKPFIIVIWTLKHPSNSQRNAFKTKDLVHFISRLLCRSVLSKCQIAAPNCLSDVNALSAQLHCLLLPIFMLLIMLILPPSRLQKSYKISGIVSGLN